MSRTVQLHHPFCNNYWNEPEQKLKTASRSVSKWFILLPGQHLIFIQGNLRKLNIQRLIQTGRWKTISSSQGKQQNGIHKYRTEQKEKAIALLTPELQPSKVVSRWPKPITQFPEPVHSTVYCSRSYEHSHPRHILMICMIKRLRKPSPSHLLVLVVLQHSELDLPINRPDFLFVFLFGP